MYTAINSYMYMYTCIYSSTHECTCTCMFLLPSIHSYSIGDWVPWDPYPSLSSFPLQLCEIHCTCTCILTCNCELKLSIYAPCPPPPPS